MAYSVRLQAYQLERMTKVFRDTDIPVWDIQERLYPLFRKHYNPYNRDGREMDVESLQKEIKRVGSLAYEKMIEMLEM